MVAATTTAGPTGWLAAGEAVNQGATDGWAADEAEAAAQQALCATGLVEDGRGRTAVPY